MPAELSLADLLISTQDANLADVAESWLWVLKGEFVLVACTRFGDLFCQGQTGKIYYLDALRGGFKLIASSEAEVLKLATEPQWREEFLRESLVKYWLARGALPGRGECLAPVPHPLLSNSKIVGKPMVMSLPVWSSICSQILEKLDP
jgi:hypothetical protein